MNSENKFYSSVLSRLISLSIILASLLVFPKALVAVSDAFTIKVPVIPERNAAAMYGSFTIDQLKYVVTAEDRASKTGTVTVVAASEHISGDIVIPASVANKGITYSVTCVQFKNSFYDYGGLIGIVIPDSATSIGDGAFNGCLNLRSVTIGKSVKSIGRWAFQDCSSLTNIVIPEGVTTIGGNVFSECTGLTNIVIPDSVTEIGENVFYRCTSLTNVTLGKSVASIGSGAFLGCSSLTNIVIPDSVTSLGAWAFAECGKLRSVTIGKSVASIGKLAFKDCRSLTDVYFKGDAPKLPEGDAFFDPSVIHYKPGTKGWKNSWSGRPTKEWSGTSNGVGAIFTIDQLKYTVLTEEPASKAGTVSVKSTSQNISGDIVIPASVANKGISYSVTLIPDHAFFRCSSLTGIAIPVGITEIGEGAFWECNSLKSVIIPDSVTEIGEGAFLHCSSLTSIIISDSVTSIGEPAFLGCSALTEIVIGKNNPNYSSLEGVLFNKDQTTLIQCPNGKNGAYTVPDSVTSIGEMAFARCSGLTGVTIGNSVTAIGEGAFAGCSSLTEIVVGKNNPNYSSLDGVLLDKDQITLIQCPGGKRGAYTVPDSVTSIDLLAFAGCSSLTEIVVGKNNPNYSSLDGVLLDKDQITLIQCPGGKRGAYTVSDSVTSIGLLAFAGCSGLTSIKIPDSVTSMGQHAFSECSSLTSITIPDSVTEIGGGAFLHCRILTDVYFKGDAPKLPEGDAFFDPSVIHYKPGTKEWTNPWSGRPTKEWIE